MNRQSSIAAFALFLAVSAVSGAGGRAPGGEAREGIRVHGHWTLVIRNRDGTVADRREFENALTANGQLLFGGLIQRQLTVGSWYVGLVASSGTYYLREAGTCAAWAGAHCSTTLALTPATGKLQLGGTIVADATFDVTAVSTFADLCAATVAPASCPGNEDNGFLGVTRTTLKDPGSGADAPAHVVPGQQITVSVVISFS